MKRLAKRFRCWLRDHRIDRETTIELPGHRVLIRSCDCGRVSSMTGRRGQYPLQRRGKS